MVSQPLTSNWMVVWVMWKRSRMAQLMASRMLEHSDTGISGDGDVAGEGMG